MSEKERGRERRRDSRLGREVAIKIVCFNWIFLIEVMAAMLMQK